MPWGRVTEGTDVTERANFSGKEMMPAESMPFGLSPWGALHMAGNAAEWCRNPKGPGFAVRGGSFEDPIYNFGYTGGYPPFLSSSPTLGFRCVLERKPEGDQGGFALNSDAVVPRYEPVDAARFAAAILPLYDYPKTPLDAKVVEVRDEKGWRREKVAFTAAGGKRTIAFLYLPKGFTGKRQLIHFIPAGDVAGGLRRLSDSIESRMMPYVLEGRALFAVALEGYLDRPLPRTSSTRPAKALNTGSSWRGEPPISAAASIIWRRGPRWTSRASRSSRRALEGPSGSSSPPSSPAIGLSSFSGPDSAQPRSPTFRRRGAAISRRASPRRS